MQGFSLSAATELTLEPLPRVTVECVGANSYSTNASGFWRINHLGTTGAVITSVVLSFQGASGPANGVYFDTDQSLPSSGGSHNLGNTYRQGSAAATGLDLAASSPYANSGFIGSNNISGASFSTIEFQFTGGSFNGNSLLFDSDTDPGTQSAASHVGMLVTVTLSTGETLNGTLAADPQNANRSFVEFQ